MDRLVEVEVKEVGMNFKSGEKCSVVFKVRNLMHTMSVAVSLSTTNPNSFTFPRPFLIIPPLSSSPCTLLSHPSHQPPLPSSPPHSISVRSAMLPTGKAHHDDLRRLFSLPGRHVFLDAVLPISLLGPHVVHFLLSNPSTSPISSLPTALSGCSPPEIHSLLPLALLSGAADSVSAMIAAGADINGKDSAGKSMLSIAVEVGNVEILNLLIAAGCEFDGGTDKVLHIAAREGRVDVVETLFKSFGGMEVNSVDSDEMTPVHVAASHGHVGALEYLLSIGADADEADVRGWTPLHHAAARGHLTAVETLLELCSGKYTVDKEGRTAFGLAAENGHAHLLPALRLDDALQRAACAGDAGGVRSSLAEGAAVDGRDQWGWTPLHRAALKGRLDCARVLLARGAQVDAIDHAGYTPLRCALEAGHASLAALLVSYGAKSIKVVVAASDSVALPPERVRLKSA